MASGLQCPGCGHVHPAGLPEIARGDATFRCYGCYRTLSVPEGWTGRPTPRPADPELSLTRDAPPGAGTRDARSSRLAGRGRSQALTRRPSGAPRADLPTQMVPEATPDGHLADFGAPPTSWTTGAPAPDRPADGSSGSPGTGSGSRGPSGSPPDGSGSRGPAGSPGPDGSGWRGPSGSPGPDGLAASPDGSAWRGPAGSPGRSGSPGPDGFAASPDGSGRRGPAGSPGRSGSPGPDGLAAPPDGSGWRGPARSPGRSGSPGPAGSTGVAGGSVGTGSIGASGGSAGPTGFAPGGRPASAPLGWVATRRSGAPVPAPIRAGVWAGAFAVGLAMTAFILRKMGILDVNRVIDLYAGTGPARFAVLLLLLPMWALLSATLAHLALETLAKRRRPRPARRTSTATRSKPPADTAAG